MFDIVRGLKDKFNFKVIIPPGIFLKKYSDIGIGREELKQLSPIKIIKQLRNFIRKESPDILQAHGTRAAALAKIALIGLSPKPKLIYTLHGFHIIRRSFFARFFLLLLERFFNYWVDILVCVSESDKKLVLKNKTIASEKIIVIKNGIALERFQIRGELVETARKELALEDNFVLSTIGRLHPPKDFSTILRALKIIASEIRNVKLLIIGAGPLKRSLDEETEKLGLREYVNFLGSREDTPLLIKLSDIIILSTGWEGLPLVPLEAGAAKKPIIASDVDGVRETLIDGKTGFLFKAGAERDLAEKILKVWQSRELRETVGENAFNFISENFSKERMLKQYQNLYQSLL